MAKTKKRAAAKRPTSKKRPARKSTKGRGKKSAAKSTALKRGAKKGLKAARRGVGSVLRAGKKTWEKLKNTAADVVD
jgi:hypothetical protein